MAAARIEISFWLRTMPRETRSSGPGQTMSITPSISASQPIAETMIASGSVQ